ncbi:MAG: hypothetical protein J7499_20175 [Sphingopyxis sp.]|nr:hypothetical protein [Sphingopyxis sp.]
MRPFTFALMLLAQRVDEALRAERTRARPNSYLVTLLRRRKRRLHARLNRSLGGVALAGR